MTPEEFSSYLSNNLYSLLGGLENGTEGLTSAFSNLTEDSQSFRDSLSQVLSDHSADTLSTRTTLLDAYDSIEWPNSIVMASDPSLTVAKPPIWGGTRSSLDETHFQDWLDNNSNSGNLLSSYADSLLSHWGSARMRMRTKKSTQNNVAANFHHPLPNGGLDAVELRYVISCWGWRPGVSGKLPGLAYWVGGGAPGGGTVHKAASSVCWSWEDWNRSTEDNNPNNNMIKGGPYIYSQHGSNSSDPDLDGQLWDENNYLDGTLRWQVHEFPSNRRYAPQDIANEQMIVRLTPTANGWMDLYTSFLGCEFSDEIRWRSASATGKAITHLHWRLMYGGDYTYMPNIGNIFNYHITDVEVEDLS